MEQSIDGRFGADYDFDDDEPTCFDDDEPTERREIIPLSVLMASGRAAGAC